MGSMSASAPRTIIARERQARALELRKQGWRLIEIADDLQVTEGAVRKMLKKALAATVDAIKNDAEGLRALQLEQIEVGKAALWDDYCAGDLGAVDRMLKLMAREAALAGLDLRPPEPEAAQQIVVVSSLPWDRNPAWTPPGGNGHETVDMSPPELSPAA